MWVSQLFFVPVPHKKIHKNIFNLLNVDFIYPILSIEIGGNKIRSFQTLLLSNHLKD